MLVSDTEVQRLIEKYRINTKVVPESIIKKAIQVEMEHSDLIGKSPDFALRIALAHLREYPDYYVRLLRMESNASKYWSKKRKPNVFL